VKCAVRILPAATACIALLTLSIAVDAQNGATPPQVELRPAPPISLPGEVDSNSPAVWDRVDGRTQLFVMTSFAGRAHRAWGRQLTMMTSSQQVAIDPWPGGGIWMEAVIKDIDGTWYGYYHNEIPASMCGRTDKVSVRRFTRRSTRLVRADQDFQRRIVVPAGHWPGTRIRHGQDRGQVRPILHARRVAARPPVHPIALPISKPHPFCVSSSEMPFVITDPCIGTKDAACVDVCPVDCIHPRKDEPEFAQTTMLYIHPDECIDCGACVPACPVAAIYDSVESTPASQKGLIEANSVYRAGEADAVARAEAIVNAHVTAHAELMGVAPAERAAAHSK